MATKKNGRAITRTISLPLSLDKRLVTRAQKEDRPISWIVRRALVQYLDAAKLEQGASQHE